MSEIKYISKALENFNLSNVNFNRDGLLPVISQCLHSGKVLMMAWMNSEAVARTLRTGQVTYWSRSRQSFWVKGETSGHKQFLVTMAIDCDRDCLLVQVRQIGAACHTGRLSCFFTDITNGPEVELMPPIA